MPWLNIIKHPTIDVHISLASQVNLYAFGSSFSSQIVTGIKEGYKSAYNLCANSDKIHQAT